VYFCGVSQPSANPDLDGQRVVVTMRLRLGCGVVDPDCVSIANPCRIGGVVRRCTGLAPNLRTQAVKCPNRRARVGVSLTLLWARCAGELGPIRRVVGQCPTTAAGVIGLHQR